MNFQLGISIYSLPILAALIAFSLLVRKQHNKHLVWIPAVGYLLSAVLLLMQGDSSLWIAAAFAIYSFLNLAQITKAFRFMGGEMVQSLFLLQGVFVIESLSTTSVFKIFWSLSAILILQMFRNYLATDNKKMPTLEIAAYWLVLLVLWWILLLHPDFTMQTLIDRQAPRSMSLFLLGASIIFLFMSYIPWRGYRNLVELNWLNAGLFFHILLQTKLIFGAEFFYQQLFVGAYAANGVRWLLFILPILAFVMVTFNTNTLRRLSVSNYFAAILILLFYSALPAKHEHIAFIAILFLGACMLLQNYAFNINGETLKIRDGLNSRIFLILSLFLPLLPLNGALRAFFPEVYAAIFRWEEYATLFYFPAALTIILMVLSIVNALIICNDKLLLNHEDTWVLRKSDVIIAFVLLPFIFLGIYPSPLYNYIQKYFIFP